MTDATKFDDDADDVFQGRHVYRQQDKLGEIQVIDFGNQRAMRFDGGHEQSRKDLFRPSALVHEYTRAMLLGQLFASTGHATILGLGGGCLVRALRTLYTEMVISAVELRQAVADVTQRYFYLPHDACFQLTIADALYYLKQQTDESTDIIFSDMYHALQVDQIQNDVRFLRQCHRNLRSNGWLIINYHQLPEEDSQFFRSLKALFTEIFVCSTGNDNHIVYAGKSDLAVSQTTRLESLAFFQEKLKSRFDLLYSRIIRLHDRLSVEGI